MLSKDLPLDLETDCPPVQRRTPKLVGGIKTPTLLCCKGYIVSSVPENRFKVHKQKVRKSPTCSPPWTVEKKKNNSKSKQSIEVFVSGACSTTVCETFTPALAQSIADDRALTRAARISSGWSTSSDKSKLLFFPPARFAPSIRARS